MAADILVSAIVPAYYRPEKLRRAVESLLAQDLDPSTYEVIVVDSSNDDQNANVVAALQSQARCSLRFFSKKPEGPGPSRNLGAEHARGRFFAFMDSDCQASPQWLREGVAAFADDVGIVQGKTIPEEGVPHGIFNFYIDVKEESFLYETANIFYRREPFEAQGGFAADLLPLADKPMGGEDVDLAWRVKRASWNSRFAESAVVAHEVVRLSPVQWMVNRRLYICPRIVRKFPELRRFFYHRYFYEKIQAYLLVAVAGVAASLFLWPAVILTLPYIFSRAAEPSKTLRGPLKLVRPIIYLPRDLVSLFLLAAGSVRFRAILL